MRNLLIASIVIVTATSAGLAPGQVIVTAGVDSEIVGPSLTAGSIIAIPLSIQHTGRDGLCGVSFDLAVVGDALRIRSVTVDPAFRYVLSDGQQALPVKTYRTERAQPHRTLDAGLGGNGTAVPLATVELEVLRQDIFASRLDLRLHATIIARRQQSELSSGLRMVR